MHGVKVEKIIPIIPDHPTTVIPNLLS